MGVDAPVYGEGLGATDRMAYIREIASQNVGPNCGPETTAALPVSQEVVVSNPNYSPNPTLPLLLTQ